MTGTRCGARAAGSTSRYSTPGTTLFTLSEAGAEFVPGRVRWDGEIVEIDLSELTNTQSSAMTWDFFKRLRDTTKMKIVLKGIVTSEDADLAAGLDRERALDAREALRDGL